MTPQPVVSIVLPTFNRLEFLPETVQSVLQQTLPEWELVIADDGSDRDVLDYFDTLRVDPRVRLLRVELRTPVCIIDEPLVRVRRHAKNLGREVGRPHLARDYSLRKLARQVTGVQRALLEEERSRNALARAAAIAARGGRWQALAAVGKSLPFSWRYPRW